MVCLLVQFGLRMCVARNWWLLNTICHGIDVYVWWNPWLLLSFRSNYHHSVSIPLLNGCIGLTLGHEWSALRRLNTWATLSIRCNHFLSGMLGIRRIYFSLTIHFNLGLILHISLTDASFRRLWFSIKLFESSLNLGQHFHLFISILLLGV